MPPSKNTLLHLTPIFLALAGLQLNANSQVTDRVSVDSSFRQADSATYESVQVSSDGRHVVFGSDATNLIPADTNAHTDVFVRDRVLGTTTRVSVGPMGLEANDDSGKGYSGLDISSDGRWVVFMSRASNLVAGDTNGVSDVFLHDRDSNENGIFDEGSGETILISKASGGAPANERSGEYGVSISGDGSKIAFSSNASNLALDFNGLYDDILVWHRSSGVITNATIAFDSAGEPVAGANGENCSYPDLSHDGSHMVFTSDAGNLLGPTELVPDINGKDDVFYSTTGTDSALTRVRASLGHLGNLGAGARWGRISGDGSQVVWVSYGASVTLPHSSGRLNVYVRHILDGVTTRLSALPDGSGAEGNRDSYLAQISSDGRFVSFITEATNLFTGDTNTNTDLALVDRDPDEDGVFATGPSNAVITLEGVTHTGAPINYFIANRGISSDGRVLAYISAADVTHHDTNGTYDAFVRDLSSSCPAPIAYCEGNVNSTGAGTYLDFSGTASVSANDLSLEIRGGVPGKVGIFYYGAGSPSTPTSFGNGLRCVNGTPGGLFRIYPPLTMDALGHAVLPSFLDKKPCDAGPGAITPGATKNFQYWYRDPASEQGSTFNLSNALRITFCS